MYIYTKKTTKSKKALIFLLILTICASGWIILNPKKSKKEVPVFHEINIPVIDLGKDAKEVGKKPFQGNINQVMEYFDGNDHEIDSISKFEGVYRMNQGIDYANKDVFDIYPIFSGTVKKIFEDTLFGKSIVIESGNLTITYQSVEDIQVKENDVVKQGNKIAKSATNVYHRDLGNHVHVVVEKDGKIIDPKLVYDKSLDELK